MIQGDVTHETGHEDHEAATLPAVEASAAVSHTDGAPVPAPHPAPVKATVVDPADVAGAVVVPAKAVQVRSSKASSVTSADSSTYQDSELFFDFGRYVGAVDPITGLRQGQGTLTYNNGNVYEGLWKDGAPDGIGEKRYKNGDVYRGNWAHGERQGRGGYLFAGGHYFEGMYQHDVPNGYGILTTVNGDRYAGHWKDGKKDGKGRETLGDGQTFIGHWKNGKKQGRGKLLLTGAAGALYGIWHEDHFFRELTEEEMGVDGAEDIVDHFGLPRDGSEPVTPRAGDAPGNPFDLQTISQRLQQQWMTGVTAMEQRLDALSHALDRATTAAPADDGIVNMPAETAAGGRRPSATKGPVTAAVAGTVEQSGPEVDAAGVEAFAADPDVPAAVIEAHVDPAPHGASTLNDTNDGCANILSTAVPEDQAQEEEADGEQKHKE